MLPEDLDAEDEPEVEQRLCECFRALLPMLKPEYAEVIEVLDLANESTEAATTRLGISANNLKVRHHRARQAARRKLEATCRVCADTTASTAPAAPRREVFRGTEARSVTGRYFCVFKGDGT